MTASTHTLVPGPRAGAGAGASAETLSERTWDEIVARAGRADYERWAEQVERTGGCARPVRLKGRVVEQTPLGQALRYSTAGEPDGELLIRCGNRRASVCPSCAFTYAGDTWHLIYAGAAGDHKGVPARVAEHPKVFASATAPSFGPVHSDPVDKNGRPARCRPRSGAQLCEHGRPTWCMRRHQADDPALGEPLCPDCYDYEAAAAFNWVAPELWRRFTIALARALAKSCDLTNSAYARLLSAQYAKVAEFQRRALIHFHAIIRLDGKPAKGADDQWPAPPLDVTPEQLADAVRAAVAHVSLTVTVGDRRLVMRFGDQVDAQPLRNRRDLDDGDLTAEQVAAYVAKYATKAAEDLGLGERRQVPDLYHARARKLPPHVLRMVEAAWDLGKHEDFDGIRRWLHMVGFRGHFSTKSRRYSTTLGKLRAERRDWRLEQERRRRSDDPALPLVDPACDDDPDADETTLVIGDWHFAGVGYRNSGDAALAASAAARAREYRRLAADHRRYGAA